MMLIWSCLATAGVYLEGEGSGGEMESDAISGTQLSSRHMSYSLTRVSWFCEDESTLGKCCINSYSNVFCLIHSGNNHLCT